MFHDLEADDSPVRPSYALVGGYWIEPAGVSFV